MEKEEILNENIIEKEVIHPKAHKKIKIFLAITGSILVIAATVLLIGYFRLNWFKSEIYNLDIKISRNTQEVNYFTETKILETRLGLTSGESNNKEITVKNNFLVVQTDREKLENNDFLNTVSLIILDVKVKMDNEEKQGISFDIFKEEIVEEFKSNPEGSKYPMAIFSFYENGTIAEINLPNNMNQSIAKSMIDLIEKIIPKISRNRTEDNNNGLKINIIKNNDMKTLVESQSNGEIENIIKSKFTKFIERDIQNGQLTSIRTNSNISLETQAEKEESTFGLKDYFYQEKSKIILKEIKKQKDIIELIQILSKYYNFINSKILLESFEIKENEKKEDITENSEKEINTSSTKIRKLYDFGMDKTFTVKTFNVLGIRGSIKIRIRIRSFRNILRTCYAEVIISTDQFEARFGNEVLVTLSKTFSTPELPIFIATFPNFLFAGVGLNGQGSLTISLKIMRASRYSRYPLLVVDFTGNIRAKAYVWANVWVAELTGGAWGTLVELNVGGRININGEISRYGSISAGQVVIFIQGKLLQFSPSFYHDWKVFDGWRANF